ncbi:hypothetical protein G9A89_011448 [Geosiphon pyriformis]|nr:hypothetical protein G9A89_011448 [Geosiphon pyriformis]
MGAASSSISTPQIPRTSNYTEKLKQCNWRNIPITGGYLLLFQKPLFQPKFGAGFENREEESESESEETSEKTSTKSVIGTSSQSRNQETCNQEKELNIRETTFRDAQKNIILTPLRSINPPAENGDEITTLYITQLMDFSREKEKIDVYMWLRKSQKAIQANNWNDQRAIQTLLFFLKAIANSWYQSLKTKPMSFAEFKDTLLEYFSNSNAIIQLQNEFNTINSILGRVHSAHSNSLPEAIMLAKALKSAEKEANYSQIINIMIEKNKTETLEKKVTQLEEELSKKIESYLISDPERNNTYQTSQRHNQEFSSSQNNCSSHQDFRTETRVCHFYKCESIHTNTMLILYHVPKPRNLPATAHGSNQQTNANYSNFQPTYLNISENLNLRNINSNIPRTENITNSQNLIQTISPVIVMENSSLAAIFPFKLEEKKAIFSGAALNEKHPITAMYTEAKINNMLIKLILDNGSAGSIMTLQLVNQLGFKVDRAVTSQIITANGSTKLSYGEIDSFPFEINSIIIPTKVLTGPPKSFLLAIMATMPEFQPHVATSKNSAPTKDPPLNLRKIQPYQPSKLISSHGLMTKEQDYWPYQHEGAKKDPNRTRPKLECSVCNKKLSSMTVCSAPDKNPRNPTHYYCNHCNKEKYDYPERHGK